LSHENIRKEYSDVFSSSWVVLRLVVNVRINDQDLAKKKV